MQQCVACVFQSHVLYVPLVLCRVLYLPPFSAAVGPAAFCPWAAQSRQTREIQRNTNPVPPWKTRSQWSNLESQLLLKLFCTNPLIHSQAPFRQGGVKDLSVFFGTSLLVQLTHSIFYPFASIHPWCPFEQAAVIAFNSRRSKSPESAAAAVPAVIGKKLFRATKYPPLSAL